MNKVTTVNLNGNAYQVEEAGYELLQKYLDSAKKKLAADPDKDEILTDFERAIAEKCAVLLRPRKNVITEKEIATIIEEMGPVEPAEGVKHSEHTSESKAEQSPPKRLYTLRDGAIIGGVANGLAAYFNIDVTIVRLLFILLVLVTGGAGILIYLLLMVIVPEARTPEEKAELRGEQFSAQQVLDRAKQKYGELGTKEHWRSVAEQNEPLLSGVGGALRYIFQAIALILGGLLGLLAGALTAVWVSVLWWLTFGHPYLPDQLHTISLWTVAVGATTAYFTLALPLGILASTFVHIGSGRQFGKQSARWLAVVASLWVLSVGIGAGVTAVTSARISNYQRTHAQIDFDNHQICINQNLCGGGTQFVFPPKVPKVPAVPQTPTQPDYFNSQQLN